MTPYSWTTYAIVVAWLYPAALKSNVALWVLLAWFMGEVWARAVEAGPAPHLPMNVYFLTDAICICGIIGYAGREWLPRVIIGIFVLEWAVYLGDQHPYYKWITLWALTLTQFVLAGPWGMIRNKLNDRGAVFRRGRPLSSHHPLALPTGVHAAQAREHGADVCQSGEAPEISWKNR